MNQHDDRGTGPGRGRTTLFGALIVAALAMAWLLARSGEYPPDEDAASRETVITQPPREPGAASVASEARVDLGGGTEDLIEQATVAQAPPATGLRIAGHCVDESGADVPDCPIEIVIERDDGGTDESRLPSRSTTGDFALEIDEVPRAVLVVAGGAQDWCRRERRMLTAGLAPGSIVDTGRIAVTRGGRLRGTMVDPDGQPVPFEELAFVPAAGALDDAFGDVDATVALRVTSDESGAFAIPTLLRTGRWRTVAGKDIDPRVTPSEFTIERSRDAVVAFVVRPGLRVTGRVFCKDGRPIAGVRIEAHTRSSVDALLAAPAYTDREGRFVLRPGPDVAKPPSRFDVTARLHHDIGTAYSARWGDALTIRTSHKGETRLMVRTTRTGEIVPAFRYRLRPAGSPPQWVIEWSAPLKDTGTGVPIHVLSNDSRELTVLPEDVRLAMSEIVLVGAGPTITVSVEDAPTIAVDVRDSGRPVAGAELLTNPFDPPALTDATGRGFVRAWSDGAEHEIVARRGDKKAATRVRPGARAVQVELPLGRGFTIVLDPAPGDARWALVSRGGLRIPQTGWLDGDRVTLDELATSDWAIEFAALSPTRSAFRHVPATVLEPLVFEVRRSLPATLIVEKRIATILRLRAHDLAAPLAVADGRREHVEWRLAPGTYTLRLDDAPERRIELTPGTPLTIDLRETGPR